MNHNPLILTAVFLGSIFTASAQLTIPSDGSDGALNITADTVIDLSQAVTGTWNQNNSTNAGKGVYDPEKWAVVFKYSSVNIDGHTTGVPSVLGGRTLRFVNHPSRAPVVWLVQGNVTIDGIVNLRGHNGTFDQVLRLTPPEPGPGGFRGGAAGPSGYGAGLGPGGGAGPEGNGSYLGSYGNPQVIPLIGGSGGQAAGQGVSGSGAGGAILIAAAGSVTVNGLIDARAGLPFGTHFNYGTSGSDGAVRIIGTTVSGTGTLNAVYRGRIRIETGALSPTLFTFPETIGVPPANPPIIWPAANVPKARVVSVDSLPAPNEPGSPLIAAADVAIQNNAPVYVVIETRDFPIEGVVQLAVIPKFGARSWLTASRISGDITLAMWRVQTTLPQGFVTLQARATQP